MVAVYSYVHTILPSVQHHTFTLSLHGVIEPKGPSMMWQKEVKSICCVTLTWTNDTHRASRSTLCDYIRSPLLYIAQVGRFYFISQQQSKSLQCKFLAGLCCVCYAGATQLVGHSGSRWSLFL